MFGRVVGRVVDRVIGRVVGRVVGTVVGRVVGREVGRVVVRVIGRVLGRLLWRDVKIVRREVGIIGREVEMAGREFEMVGREVETVRKEVGMAGREVEILGKEGEIIESEVEMAGRDIEVAGKEGEIVGMDVEMDGSSVGRDVGREGEIFTREVTKNVGLEGEIVGREFGREIGRDVGNEGEMVIREAVEKVGTEGRIVGMEVAMVGREVGREFTMVRSEVGREAEEGLGTAGKVIEIDERKVDIDGREDIRVALGVPLRTPMDVGIEREVAMLGALIVGELNEIDTEVLRELKTLGKEVDTKAVPSPLIDEDKDGIGTETVTLVVLIVLKLVKNWVLPVDNDTEGTVPTKEDGNPSPVEVNEGNRGLNDTDSVVSEIPDGAMNPVLADRLGGIGPLVEIGIEGFNVDKFGEEKVSVVGKDFKLVETVICIEGVEDGVSVIVEKVGNVKDVKDGIEDGMILVDIGDMGDIIDVEVNVTGVERKV